MVEGFRFSGRAVIGAPLNSHPCRVLANCSPLNRRNATAVRTDVTDPLGHTTQYSYDSGCHLTRVQDALGHKADLTYNDIGQMATVTRYNGNTPLTTSFTYSDGDLVGITDPLGRTTRFVNDVQWSERLSKGQRRPASFVIVKEYCHCIVSAYH